MHSRVDPAALLIAVFAVGASSLVSSGAWEAINSIVALTVGAIIACYVWPLAKQVRHANEEDGRYPRRHRVAQALTFGFIAVTAFAWPIQLILLRISNLRDCDAMDINGTCGGVKAVLSQSTHATYWSCLAGVVTALTMYWLLGRAWARIRMSAAHNHSGA